MNNYFSDMQKRKEIAIDELSCCDIRFTDLGEYNQTVDLLKDTLDELSNYDKGKAEELAERLNDIWVLSPLSEE